MLQSKIKFLVCSFIFTFFICCSFYSQKKTEWNLSSRNLDSIPNLSKNYDIIKLDLSGNNINFWDEKRLPPNLKVLNLSNNKIKGEVKISSKTLPNLISINLAYNKIEKFYSYSYSLDTIKVNNNEITNLLIFNTNKSISTKRINYLDISYNKKLSNALNFSPSNIKYIKHEGILNDKELYYKLIRIRK